MLAFYEYIYIYIFKLWKSILLFRYSPEDILPSHFRLDPEPLWHLFHSCRPGALFDRRVCGILHHITRLPLLPHAGQLGNFASKGSTSGEDLVPTFFLFRSAHRRHGAQRVRDALGLYHGRFRPGCAVPTATNHSSWDENAPSSRKETGGRP